MNGELLSAKHGGPVRVTIPGKSPSCVTLQRLTKLHTLSGTIGARSVKWLNRVKIRKDESPNFYQRKDYKVDMSL